MRIALRARHLPGLAMVVVVALIAAAAVPATARTARATALRPAGVARVAAPRISVGSGSGFADRAVTAEVEPVAAAGALDALPPAVRSDTGTGASGALRVRVLPPGNAPPGVYPVPGGVAGRPFSFLSSIPFAAKRGEWMGAYHVGMWPAELHNVRSSAYENPAGFIEVTPENVDLQVSDHFRLGDFVTHDAAPFPKYVVLREALLDKLELVLTDLAMHGVPTQHVVVLSGFRTPAYNMALGDASGRARESRHQYGDASDIIIDANHDGRMDDLNGDGRVDAQDVRVIEAAVNRVEQAHPELAGGLGLYEATGPSGPFAHIDVRGTRARWGTALHQSYRADRQFPGFTGFEPRARPAAAGHCFAEGASAVLCQAFRHTH